MGSSSVDFRSSLKLSYVPRTISNLLKEVSNVDNFSDKLLVLNDHLQKHQEELSTIEPFKSHLPQCMLLLMDAIETLKEEVLNVRDGMMFESNEKALVEFLSMKRRNYEILQRESLEKVDREEKNTCISFCDQLCKLNHDDEKQKTTLQDTSTNQSSTMAAARQPVKEVAEGAGYGDLNPRVRNEAMNFQSKPLSKPIRRKNRRSWTPELHERFVKALEYLGGPQVAKPKQIRDVMKVEGLTNDQVKSHLQKYRLSSRRASPATADPPESVEKFQNRCI